MPRSRKAPPSPDVSSPGCRQAAPRIEQGLTLVPYRAYNERGHLTWYCKWVKLQPGESIAQAAVRLSVVPPPTKLTPQQQAFVQAFLARWEKYYKISL